MADKPPRATHHCRHYSFDIKLIKAHCAVGCSRIEIDRFACMPIDPERDVAPCDQRQDYTDEERAAWEEWNKRDTALSLQVFAAIPQGKPGDSGEIDCPKCDTGRVKYWFAWENGHVRGMCTTDGCMRFMA